MQAVDRIQDARYDSDITRPLSFLTAEAPVPLLDRAGVEAARLARAARGRLVETSPSVTHAMLASARGVDENTVRQWVRRHRRAHKLVALENNGQLLIPTFQFDETFDLDSDAAHLISRLREQVGLSEWAVWDWFYAVDPWVGRKPVDLLVHRGIGGLDRLIDKFDAGDG